MGFGFGTGGVVLFVVCLFCFVFFFFSVWVLSSVWHWKQVLAATKCFFWGGSFCGGWRSGRVLQQLLHQMETRNELGPYMHHQEE